MNYSKRCKQEEWSMQELCNVPIETRSNRQQHIIRLLSSTVSVGVYTVANTSVQAGKQACAYCRQSMAFRSPPLSSEQLSTFTCKLLHAAQKLLDQQAGDRPRAVVRGKLRWQAYWQIVLLVHAHDNPALPCTVPHSRLTTFYMGLIGT